ncbi:MAG TPA: hypothetical protein VEF03_05195, partial [Candidatus Binataceae bacterium]|nr:hypothetical protein [Candidatus Binataceae bacterium]
MELPPSDTDTHSAPPNPTHAARSTLAHLIDGANSTAVIQQRPPTDLRLPLVIGVSGHRDLRVDCRASLEEQVRRIFIRLKSLYPNTPLMVLSPLAEGADRLAAKVAVSPEIDARLVVPMPMRREHYERDFVTARSRDEFATMLASAATTIELG